MLQAALNGSRDRSEHPALPVTPEQIAREAQSAVEAGATLDELLQYADAWDRDAYKHRHEREDNDTWAASLADEPEPWYDAAAELQSAA